MSVVAIVTIQMPNEWVKWEDWNKCVFVFYGLLRENRAQEGRARFNLEAIAMMGVDDVSDPAMLELFRAELDSHLPVLSEGLLALEKDSDQPRWFEAMMRAAHSIKGAARIVGVEGAVRVAHVLEDCFVAAQKREIQLGPGAIDLLLRGVDVLGSFSHAAAPSLTADALSALVGAIGALRQGEQAKPATASHLAIQLPDLDAKGCEQLRQQLIANRQRGVTSYRLDFAHVREFEPTALLVLALFARLPCLNGSAASVEVAHAIPEVCRVLHLTGLDTLWRILPEREH